jgi:hypothetical protein
LSSKEVRYEAKTMRLAKERKRRRRRREERKGGGGEGGVRYKILAET